MVETIGYEDALALVQVQSRYERYKDMYTNCTVVDGNLEIVFLIGPSTSNQTFNLDFLRNVREVTSRACITSKICNALSRFVTRV